jgi:hypothetical protein
MVDFNKMFQNTFSNTGVKVIGGDLTPGEWKYETGILWGAFDQIQMHGHVKTIALQTEESIKKLPEMAGPVGLLAGVMLGGNKKQVCALCELNDGRKFLATMDSKVYQELLGISLTKN